MHRWNERIERQQRRQLWTAAAGLAWLAVLVWLVVREWLF